MDPVLSPNLSTSSDHNSNVTAASQTNPKDHILSFDPNFHANGWVPPAALTALACANSLYCDASLAIMQRGPAMMPINASNCKASTVDYTSTNPTTLSNYSLNNASVETSHSSGSSSLGNLCYNTASRDTRTPPHRPVTSPGYVDNGTSSDIVPVVEASSSSLRTPDHRIEKTSRRLASTKVLKPKQPPAIVHLGYDKYSDTTAYAQSSSSLATSHQSIQTASVNVAPTKVLQTRKARATDHAGYDKHSDATASAKPPHHHPVSVIKPNSKYGVSKCPRKGCSAMRRGKAQQDNMRTHVRDVHEKPAPPTCEICKKVYVKNDSLKRHIEASHHAVQLPEGARIVRITRADGTVYATYPEVHDYVNMRKMETA